MEGGREIGRPWEMPNQSFDLAQPPSGILKIAAVSRGMAPLFWAGLPVEWKRIQFTKGMYVLAAQLCLTLCDPMDWSPPGSSVRGIFQARILEWCAIYSSRGSS